jgi:MraZ protein
VFLGRHNHTLDAKGRLAIPARFRELLANGAVLTRGADRSLALYPAESWRALGEKIDQLPMGDADARSLRRFVFAEATLVEFDGQGRILIPSELRAFAGIDRSVVVIGVNRSVEIWATAVWEQLSASVEADADAVFARLASMI